MERFYFVINHGVIRFGAAVANVYERGVSEPVARDVTVNNAERIVHAMNLAANVGKVVDITT